MKNNKIIAVLLGLGLLIGVFVTVKMAGQRQENRSKASGTTVVTLALVPATDTLKVNETKSFDLQARFTGGSSAERLDYFYTKLIFLKDYLNVGFGPNNWSIDVSKSKLNKIINLSTPEQINASGIIEIELGADKPNTGPDTSNYVTIATIYFKGIAKTPDNNQTISFDSVSEVVNNSNSKIGITLEGAKYGVTEDISVPTNTPIPPTNTGIPNSPTPTGGSIPTVTPTNPPVPTATPTSTMPSATPTAYQPTVKPTPPSDRDKYIIDIGDKQSLVIDIGKGTGTGVQIKFKTKLADVQGHPDLLLKLRVKDELAFLNNPQDTVSNGDSCKNPPSSIKDYWIPVKANDSGVYAPDNSAVPYANANTKTRKSSTGGKTRASDVNTAPVSADGWVTLEGLYNDRYYSLFLKGPKTKATRTAEHIIWQGGPQSLPEFDWSTDDLALQPGDLMDPNNNYEQNCTVNSIDLALIEARLAKTDLDSLRVADVNYDGVVNGNDISKVVHTLSTKPDDDH